MALPAVPGCFQSPAHERHKESPLALFPNRVRAHTKPGGNMYRSMCPSQCPPLSLTYRDNFTTLPQWRKLSFSIAPRPPPPTLYRGLFPKIPGSKFRTSTTHQWLPRQRPERRLVCPRAALDGDWVLAVGAVLCVAHSAASKYPLLQLPRGREDSRGREDEGSSHQKVPPQEEPPLGFTLGDVRYGAMTVLSIIPFFNWLAWVLAWVDSGDYKYAVYAAVYSAPYFRFGLDLFSEDSWAPVICLAACVIQVQIDASDLIVNSEDPISESIQMKEDTQSLQAKEDPKQLPADVSLEHPFGSERGSDPELRRWDDAFQERQVNKKTTPPK